MVSNKRLKAPVFVIAGILTAATFLIFSVPARTATQDDIGALFKSKCVACHGATAEKKFDSTLAQEEMLKVILTGKKMEKPPNMPAYAEKGITEDQAKALVAHMKSLKG